MMEMFDGGKLEHKVMEKSGCLNFATTSWEPFKDENVLERCLSYKFNRHVSVFGGEATCTQQKSPLADDQGWILNEVMALHDVPFSDHFRVRVPSMTDKVCSNKHPLFLCIIQFSFVFFYAGSFQVPN